MNLINNIKTKISEITQHATGISTRILSQLKTLDQILRNLTTTGLLQAQSNPKEIEQTQRILSHVETIVSTLQHVLDENKAPSEGIISKSEASVASLLEVMNSAQSDQIDPELLNLVKATVSSWAEAMEHAQVLEADP
ncbi:MAG: hypothetical protein CL521_04520 [Actinobacteria bacterium]|nr:hypothetical protein [Actinomycetota bacterium]